MSCVSPEKYLDRREKLREKGEVLSEKDKLEFAVPRYAYDSGLISEGVYEKAEIRDALSEAIEEFPNKPTNLPTKMSYVATLLEDLENGREFNFKLEKVGDPIEDTYRVSGNQ